MIGTIDYVVIVVYLLFMMALGPIYKRFNSTASDYFRGGGGMLWWMVGASSFMVTFSAWTFTGAAGQAYKNGTFVLLLFTANAVGLVFSILFTAHRYRQLRVITPVEAIRNRFGKVNEQFFTWLPTPLYIIMGGIGVYAIGIFMSAVFKVELWIVIVGLGTVVTVMSVMGGAAAVVASDFIQFLTIIVVSLVMMVRTLARPEIGGLGGFFEKLPAQHTDWSLLMRPEIILIFAVTLFFNQLVQGNSLQNGAARYVFVKSGRDARKAAAVALIGFIFFPAIWLIPAMAATTLHPDLGSEFPGLNHPEEAAYVATALTVLPSGMMGLLVCAIFAATMSSMDSGLNRSAGIMVRNFYLPIINPQASEKQQLKIGKLLTLLLGTIMTVMGLVFAQYKGLPLFELILLLAALVGLPIAIPLFYGIFVRRVPAWSAWSTVVAGMTFGWLSKKFLTPDIVADLMGYTQELTEMEANHLLIGITTAVNLSVCTLWFLGTMPWWKTSTPEYKEQVDDFFDTMHTPVDQVAEEVPGWDVDRRHYVVMGFMCMSYGALICLLALLPNDVSGRLAFLFCGGIIGGLGVILTLISKRKPLAVDTGAQAAGRVESD